MGEMLTHPFRCIGNFFVAINDVREFLVDSFYDWLSKEIGLK